MTAALEVRENEWQWELQERGEIYSEVVKLRLTLHVEAFVFYLAPGLDFVIAPQFALEIYV